MKMFWLLIALAIFSMTSWSAEPYTFFKSPKLGIDIPNLDPNVKPGEVAGMCYGGGFLNALLSSDQATWTPVNPNTQGPTETVQSVEEKITALMEGRPVNFNVGGPELLARSLPIRAFLLDRIKKYNAILNIDMLEDDIAADLKQNAPAEHIARMRKDLEQMKRNADPRLLAGAHGQQIRKALRAANQETNRLVEGKDFVDSLPLANATALVKIKRFGEGLRGRPFKKALPLLGIVAENLKHLVTIKQVTELPNGDTRIEVSDPNSPTATDSFLLIDGKTKLIKATNLENFRSLAEPTKVGLNPLLVDLSNTQANAIMMGSFVGESH